MREGLAREFPEAVRGIDWLRSRASERRPPLWNEPAVWAAISGIGAGFLVAAVVQAVVGLTNAAMQSLRAPMPFPLFPVVTIAGTAAAAAVALCAGGAIALALDLTYVALGIALRLPSMSMFCERAGGVFPAPGFDQCTAFGFLASLWPQFVGIGLGIALARAVTPRGNGINSLLRVAGMFAIALFVVSHIWGMTIAQTTDPSTSTLTIAAGIAAAAVAAGVVAAQLPGGVRGATVVAAIWLVPWATLTLPSASGSLTSGSLTGIAPENVVPMVGSILIDPIAAAFLVLSAAIAARSRFVPREPA
ncbi:MAG: hypothetical protein M3P38_06840 [Chloroflexota bacterium]|nr:hypothetical protein [Chloroflexota bacterium]